MPLPPRNITSVSISGLDYDRINHTLQLSVNVVPSEKTHGVLDLYEVLLRKSPSGCYECEDDPPVLRVQVRTFPWLWIDKISDTTRVFCTWRATTRSLIHFQAESIVTTFYMLHVEWQLTCRDWWHCGVEWHWSLLIPKCKRSHTHTHNTHISIQTHTSPPPLSPVEMHPPSLLPFSLTRS